MTKTAMNNAIEEARIYGESYLGSPLYSFDSAKDATKFLNHLRRNNVDDVVLQYRETLNEWWAVKANF